MTPPAPLRIALTSGEPAGIGPELCVQLAQTAHPCEIVCFGDPELIAQRAEQLKLNLAIRLFDPQQPALGQAAGTLCVSPLKLAVPAKCGRLNPANSEYVVQCITAATQACISGTVAGMVTAPVHKAVINDAGIAFTGHTEFIAELTGGYPVMILATPGLRVALATTHLPLQSVSQAITQQTLTAVIQALHQDLKRYFGLCTPRILVCGLNPHAGENGHLGREELDVIIPTLDALRLTGIDLVGPLPADTLFTAKYLTDADAVLAMYHDQGLPVLKYAGFGQAVNITLGLPIIRTSVDHGTALELAGTGMADLGSLAYALETAMHMANHRTQTL